MNSPIKSRQSQKGSHRDLLMAFVMATVAIVTPISAVADESALKRCTSIEDSEARLDCYDAVASSVSTTKVSVGETKSHEDRPAEAEERSEPPRPQTVRAYSETEETFTAEVTRCDKGQDGRYYFFFSSGQVWKQVKAGSKRYKDCSFTVTVTRDFFGYKMQRDSEERPVRISLVK